MNLTPAERASQRNLTRLYVSLALARAAADQYAARQPADPFLRAMLNTMDLMAELLEETIRGTTGFEHVSDAATVISSDSLM